MRSTFYRLNISTGPYIDAIFPPMVEPGKTGQITLFGRNLPGGKPDPAAVIDGHVLEKLTVTVNAPGDASSTGLRLFGLFMPQWDSGRLRISLDGPTGVPIRCCSPCQGAGRYRKR